MYCGHQKQFWFKKLDHHHQYVWVDACLCYLLQHLLSGGQFLPMFLQGTFEVSDLLSLCFHLVSQDAHLKGGTFMLYTRLDIHRKRKERMQLWCKMKYSKRIPQKTIKWLYLLTFILDSKWLFISEFRESIFVFLSFFSITHFQDKKNKAKILKCMVL